MSSLSTSDLDATAGPRLPFRSDPRSQQRLSHRYSRFVGMMKLLLPMIGLGLIIVVLAWPNGSEQDSGFQLSFMPSRDDAADQLIMLNPRYIGTDSEQRPFTVTATSAAQDPKDQRRVTLDALQADMTMDDGAWLTVIASGGVYHQSQQTLRLDGPVNIFSDLGYEFHAESALIDLAAGGASSDQPVYGQGPFGSVRSDRLDVRQHGQRLLFDGNVTMIIRPQQKQNP